MNGNTYPANLNTTTHKAFVTIPYTDTTAARTCVLKGYRSGSQLTSANVAMTAGIGYYTASLSTSAYLWRNGAWEGVTGVEWTKTVATSTVTESSSGLLFTCPNGNYWHRFTMSPTFDMRGYTNFEVKYSTTGGIIGGGSGSAAGNSFIRLPGSVGSPFVNLDDTTTAQTNIVKTSTNGTGSNTDAVLSICVAVEMGYAPATLNIEYIKFV